MKGVASCLKSNQIDKVQQHNDSDFVHKKDCNSRDELAGTSATWKETVAPVHERYDYCISRGTLYVQ